MPTAPPIADSKKPATPPPSRDAKQPGAKAGEDAAVSRQQDAGPEKQSSAGDQAQQDAGAGAAEQSGANATNQQRFDRMAVRAKLAVSQPGDAVEREADAVADQVMRMGASDKPPEQTTAPASAVSRQLSRAPTEETSTQSTQGDQAEQPPQQAADEAPPSVERGHPRPASTEGTQGGVATEAGDAEPQVARAVSPEVGTDATGRLSVPTDFVDQMGEGQALDPDTRALFEQRLETDLSGVRVHTDASADKAARAIHARAFTFGQHIAFANGQYDPASQTGQRLLAHELAHVRQQQGGVSRRIMREAAGSAPAGGDANEIAIKGIRIPAFKFAHYDGMTFRRKANYSRNKGGNKSKQKSHWNKGTKGARTQFPSEYGLQAGAIYAAVPKKTRLSTKNEDLLVGEAKAIARMIQLPRWNKEGKPNPHDIDHQVELQIGGPGMDKLDNLELRDSKANQESGRAIDGQITKKLRQAKDKENGDPEKIRANPSYTFVFSEFVNGGGKDSSVWSVTDINNLEAAAALNIYDPDATKDEGKVKAWPKGVDKEDFFGGPDLLVLYPSNVGGEPVKIKLNAEGKPKRAGQVPKKWIPGFSIDSFDVDTNSGGQIGSVSMTFDVKHFPKGYGGLGSIPIRRLSKGLTKAGYVSVIGVRNKVSRLLKQQTPVPQSSPVTVDEVDILPGTGLTISGQVHPSVKLLGGPIDFQVQGRSFQLSKTFTADEVNIPGPFKVTASSLTVAITTERGFSVSGFVGFAIPRLGEGSLSGRGKPDGFRLAGTFSFDRALFDGKAELKATYDKSGDVGKFSGAAKLKISEKKIKGIKEATIDATIDDERFTLDGEAQTSIPGIKTFAVAIEFVDTENFSIGGKGDFDELPGIEKGSLTMTLVRSPEGWGLSGKGSATPKLPGGAKGEIQASYDKGVVLARGSVDFQYGDGLLSGGVTAAVTNAEGVDETGNPSGAGGETFQVFGEGKIRAALIKDRLDGKLKLRLLPDGSVRVGGGLEVKPFEVFGKYPKDGGEFFNKTISTPRVPIPGLGFSAGSISVGVTIGASVTLKAHAAVGPGKISAITITVEEFDPAEADLSTMKFSGGGTFVVYADAGFGAKATVELIFSAAVAELVGGVGVEGSVGIPADKPVLSAKTDFTYSQTDGLDISGEMNLSIAPELKLRVFGEVSARLNVVVDTITVWSKDFTMAEANYKLPVGINATGTLGYNSKTGKIRPEKISDAIKIERPSLEGDAMKRVVMGEKAKPKVSHNTDRPKTGWPWSQINRAPAADGDDDGDGEGNGQTQPAGSTDEGLIARLGPGEPLDLATRGFFEQRMRADFSQVRVHTGPAAEHEARLLSARAFTVGDHIAFARGAYRPDTEAGRALLAHELAHVKQQSGGAARQVMRVPTEGAGTGSTGGGAGDANDQQARIDRARRTLEQFVVPVSKRRHGHAYAQWLNSGRLRHGPNYDRRADAPAQIGNWETPLNGLETQAVWTRHFERLGISPETAGPQSISFAGRPESRTFRDWVSLFKRPQWNHQGVWLRHRLEVDHIVELQVAGWPQERAADTAENYELLDKSTNTSAGSTIYINLRRKMRDLLAAEHDVSTRQVPLRPGSSGADGVPDAETELKTRGVEFTGIEGGTRGGPRGSGSRGDASSEFWVLGELQSGAHLVAIQSPPESTGGSGTAAAFLLLSAGSGGLAIARIPTRTGRVAEVSGSASRRLASMRIQRLRFGADDYGTAAADAPIGTLEATWQLPEGVEPSTPEASFTIRKARDGQYTGYLEAPATIEATTPGLSPIQFSDVSFDAGGLSASGRLVPSLPLFANQPIDVTWTHGDIRFARTFSADDIALSVPGVFIDAAALTVFLDGNGFGAEGSIDVALAHIGVGTITAGVDGEGRFSAEGELNLDTRQLDEANIRLWYRDGAFGGAGHIGITRPGRIRGIDGASVDVNVDEHSISARGTAQPSIPGVQRVDLSASYSTEEGLLVSGDLRLAEIAGIRSGQMHAELRNRDDTWRVSASGTAVPALPGISSTVSLSYADGLFDGSITVDYARSIFSGSVTVGLTNRPVGPDGEIVGEAPADGTPPAHGGGASGAEAGAVSLYGEGQVTARLTDWLQGGIGVRVRPSGDLLIGGQIGISRPLTVFEQYPSPQRARRDLFRMPTVSVPLIGVSLGGTVVGVALTINGRITGHAHVGPGRLTQTELRIEDFNPAEPSSLHITGDAEFNLPAEAGVGASMDAGLTLGAAIINATAGINMGAEALVRADVTPHVDLDWRPSSGLHLHAALNASLSPRLAFNINGFAEVTANAVVTTFSLWRKDWNLANREIGSSLTLGVNVPVDYYSDDRGVQFDPERVTFQVPSLNEETLDQLVNQEPGGSERVTRPT